MKQTIYIAVFCLFIISCKKEIEYTHPTKVNSSTIDLIKETANGDTKLANFESLFSGYDIIRLNTDKNNFIGQIDRILLNNDTLYVIDKTFAKSILICDMSGNLLGRITTTNRKGPGEFKTISSVVLNSDKSRVEIYDSYLAKFIFFDLLGNFIEEQKIPFPFSNHAYSHLYNKYYFYNNYIPINNKKRFRLTITDDNFQFSKGYFPFNENQDFTALHSMSSNNFHVNERGEVFFAEMLRNTVYKLIDEEIEEKYSLEFQTSPPPDFLEETLDKNYDVSSAYREYDLIKGGLIFNDSLSYFKFTSSVTQYVYNVILRKGEKISYTNIWHPSESFAVSGCKYYNEKKGTMMFGYNPSEKSIIDQIADSSPLKRMFETFDDNFIDTIILVCELK